MVSLPSSRRQCTFKFQRVLSAFPVERLPELLPEELLREVLGKHKCLFGGIFHPALVTWAFLCQVIRDGKDATCQAAVARISNFLLRVGRDAPHANTGDYCHARAKLKPSAIRELAIHIASLVLDNQEESWRWKKRNTVLIDGFTFKMPDTPKNQTVYPQHTAQKPGLGFPIARVVALLHLGTGCLLDATIGPYQGKDTSEIAMLRELMSSLKPGDIVVADRHFCGYWLIAMLMQKGIHVCFRKHQARHTDFRKGRRLGKNDHIVTWKRGTRPNWMTKEMYRSLPEKLELREVKYVISEPGRKQSPFVVVTSMLERSGEGGASSEEIAELYGFRWNVELDIRSIKTHLNMDFMRCKSPPMVSTEFWMKLLAYNLIRMTTGLAAKQESILPREISFVSTCQYILSNWDMACFSSLNSDDFIHQFLRRISQCEVGRRPGRFEPRCVKRRRDQYKLMMEPRGQLQQRLSKGDNSFESNRLR